MAEYFGWPAIAKALGVSVVTARAWHRNLGLLVYKRNRPRSSPPPFSRWCWATDDSLILAGKISRAHVDRESAFGTTRQGKPVGTTHAEDHRGH